MSCVCLSVPSIDNSSSSFAAARTPDICRRRQSAAGSGQRQCCDPRRIDADLFERTPPKRGWAEHRRVTFILHFALFTVQLKIQMQCVQRNLQQSHWRMQQGMKCTNNSTDPHILLHLCVLYGGIVYKSCLDGEFPEETFTQGKWPFAFWLPGEFIATWRYARLSCLSVRPSVCLSFWHAPAVLYQNQWWALGAKK